MSLTKKTLIDDHLDYPDIWEHGIENYPFARSRILPIFYEVPEGSKVLDIGCNSGEFIKYLKEKKGCDVYGVDISQKVVDIAKAKGLNVQCVDAEKLPFPDETFDVVTLMEVLEHLADPVSYLKEIRRVLKQDGIFLGSCPHEKLEHYLWSDERLHRQYYNEVNLKVDLNQAFEKVYLQVLNGAQYQSGFINSFLAGEPCQMLFKAGGQKCEPWEEFMRKTTDTRVYWGFTQYQGVIYYRMRGFADKMDKYGIESAYEMFSYDLSEYQMSWQQRLFRVDNGQIVFNKIMTQHFDELLKVADLSVWQIVGNQACVSLLESAKEAYKKPIVTEVDDWLFDLPSYNIASHPYKPNSPAEQIAFRQLEISDVIICSTQFIKDGLLQIFPDKPIYVIPNSIDFSVWDNAKPIERPEYQRTDEIVRIGYTGCGNHNGDLELVKRPLAKLMQEFPNVELYVSGKYADPSKREEPALREALIGLPRVKYSGIWAPINTYPEEIKGWQIDIGIAPLRDNNFNRAKSNLRWLEYSAMGVPTVASDVYPFHNSVKNGETGILCKNSDLAWYESLRDLIVNEGKRIAMGKRAYDEVKANFNMDLIAKQYADVLKEIKWTAATSKQRLVTSSGTPVTTDGQLAA